MSIIVWSHTDETLTLHPDVRHIWLERADAFIQSVPWEDDGRFLCAELHWVRTGFDRCPSCDNPVKYKYVVAHDYLLQSPKHKTIRDSLWNSGIKLTVLDQETLIWTHDRYVKDRMLRQRRAPVDVMTNINNNLKLERKWATYNKYLLVAASGQAFGNSRPGSVPAWIPDDR
eukprot:7423701-Pyramimonas_sp.AAC.1